MKITKEKQQQLLMHEKKLQAISLDSSGRNSSTDCCMEKVKNAN